MDENLESSGDEFQEPLSQSSNKSSSNSSSKNKTLGLNTSRFNQNISSRITDTPQKSGRRVFITKSNCTGDMAAHDTNSVICKHCNTTFPSSHAMIQHLMANIHEKEKNRFKCVECNLCFANKHLIEAHRREKHLLVSYSVKECEEVEDLPPTHIQQDENKEIKMVFRCNICKESFQSEYLRTKHRHEKHPDRQYEKIFSREFITTLTPTSHKCSPCKRKMSVSREEDTPKRPKVILTNNKIQETKDETRIYKCNSCELHFISDDVLTKHIVACNKDVTNSVKCQICERPFYQPELSVHILRDHNIKEPRKINIVYVSPTDQSTNENRKKEIIYKCKKCDTHFTNSKWLKYHLSSGKHNKNKLCDVCELAFCRKSYPVHLYMHHIKHQLQKKDFHVKNDVDDDSTESSDSEDEAEKKKKKKTKRKVESEKTNKPKKRRIRRKRIVSNESDISNKPESETEENNTTDNSSSSDEADIFESDESDSCTNKSNKANSSTNRPSTSKQKYNLYRCGICSLNFVHERHLKIHISRENHNADVRAGCAHCGFTFDHALLGRHIKYHHDKLKLIAEDFNIVTCNQNGDRIPTTSEENTSKATNPPKKSSNAEKQHRLYKCNVCKVLYLNKNQLLKHLRNKNHYDSKYLHSCSICHFKFTKKHLLSHRWKHHELLNLAKKDFTIVNSSNLKTPLEISTEKQSSNSKARRNPLEEDKILYRCDVCDIHYTMQRSLNAHITRKEHNPRGKILCATCNLMFTTSSFDDHKTVHHEILNLNRNELIILSFRENGERVQIQDPVNVRVTTTVNVGTQNETPTQVHQEVQTDLQETVNEQIAETIENTNQVEMLDQDTQTVIKAVNRSLTPRNESTERSNNREAMRKRTPKMSKLFKCRACDAYFLTFLSYTKHIVSHRRLHRFRNVSNEKEVTTSLSNDGLLSRLEDGGKGEGGNVNHKEQSNSKSTLIVDNSEHGISEFSALLGDVVENANSGQLVDSSAYTSTMQIFTDAYTTTNSVKISNINDQNSLLPDNIDVAMTNTETVNIRASTETNQVPKDEHTVTNGGKESENVIHNEKWHENVEITVIIPEEISDMTQNRFINSTENNEDPSNEYIEVNIDIKNNVEIKNIAPNNECDSDAETVVLGKLSDDEEELKSDTKSQIEESIAYDDVEIKSEVLFLESFVQAEQNETDEGGSNEDLNFQTNKTSNIINEDNRQLINITQNQINLSFTENVSREYETYITESENDVVNDTGRKQQGNEKLDYKEQTNVGALNVRIISNTDEINVLQADESENTSNFEEETIPTTCAIHSEEINLHNEVFNDESTDLECTENISAFLESDKINENLQIPGSAVATDCNSDDTDDLLRTLSDSPMESHKILDNSNQMNCDIVEVNINNVSQNEHVSQVPSFSPEKITINTEDAMLLNNQCTIAFIEQTSEITRADNETSISVEILNTTPQHTIKNEINLIQIHEEYYVKDRNDYTENLIENEKEPKKTDTTGSKVTDGLRNITVENVQNISNESLDIVSRFFTSKNDDKTKFVERLKNIVINKDGKLRRLNTDYDLCSRSLREEIEGNEMPQVHESEHCQCFSSEENQEYANSEPSGVLGLKNVDFEEEDAENLSRQNAVSHCGTVINNTLLRKETEIKCINNNLDKETDQTAEIDFHDQLTQFIAPQNEVTSQDTASEAINAVEKNIDYNDRITQIPTRNEITSLTFYDIKLNDSKGSTGHFEHNYLDPNSNTEKLHETEEENINIHNQITQCTIPKNVNPRDIIDPKDKESFKTPSYTNSEEVWEAEDDADIHIQVTQVTISPAKVTSDDEGLSDTRNINRNDDLQNDDLDTNVEKSYETAHININEQITKNTTPNVTAIICDDADKEFSSTRDIKSKEEHFENNDSNTNNKDIGERVIDNLCQQITTPQNEIPHHDLEQNDTIVDTENLSNSSTELQPLAAKDIDHLLQAESSQNKNAEESANDTDPKTVKKHPQIELVQTDTFEKSVDLFSSKDNDIQNNDVKKSTKNTENEYSDNGTEQHKELQDHITHNSFDETKEIEAGTNKITKSTENDNTENCDEKVIQSIESDSTSQDSTSSSQASTNSNATGNIDKSNVTDSDDEIEVIELPLKISYVDLSDYESDENTNGKREINNIINVDSDDDQEVKFIKTEGFRRNKKQSSMTDFVVRSNQNRVIKKEIPNTNTSIPTTSNIVINIRDSDDDLL